MFLVPIVRNSRMLLFMVFTPELQTSPAMGEFRLENLNAV